MIRRLSTALQQEVVVIAQLMFGPPRWRWSNAHSVTSNLKRSGHTKTITKRSIGSNVNTRKAQLLTCNVVVGLVLCKSSEGSHVVFLTRVFEGILYSIWANSFYSWALPSEPLPLLAMSPVNLVRHWEKRISADMWH